jgi:DNA repair exonuclease SbcCD ATPase subunit
MTNHKEEKSVNLKTIKALSADIEKVNADLQKLEGEATRCREVMTEGDQHAQAIAELEHKREDILAQAFIDHTPPDTAAVDAEMKKAKAAREDAIAAGRVAAKALRIVEGRIADHQARLTELQELRRAEVGSWAMANIKPAEEAFDKAIEDLGAAWSRIYAASNIAASALGRRDISARADLYKLSLHKGVVRSNLHDFRPPPWLSFGEDISPRAMDLMRAELDAVGVTISDIT